MRSPLVKRTLLSVGKGGNETPSLRKDTHWLPARLRGLLPPSWIDQSGPSFSRSAGVTGPSVVQTIKFGGEGLCTGAANAKRSRRHTPRQGALQEIQATDESPTAHG
jgi:hypothetical protein